MARKKRPGAIRSKYATNPIVQSFMLRLKEWRLKHGLTLKVISKKTGFSMAIICEWEHGNRFPSVEHLAALSKFTKIPAYEFLRPLNAMRNMKPPRTRDHA